MLNKKIFYIGLSTFCKAGGIEKVNKAWLKALDSNPNFRFTAAILLDDQPDEKYISKKKFRGYKGDKISFFFTSLFRSLFSDIIVVSHINIAPVIFIVKLLKPKTKIYLHAHGIEVWHPLNWLQKTALLKVDYILAVSNYTKNQLIVQHHLPGEKVKIFPNTLDPFFVAPINFNKSKDLLTRYGLQEETKILFTLARLSSEEQYKGYDQVIKIIPKLLKTFPNLVYLIAGKADKKEQNRLISLIRNLNLENHVQLIGYLVEGELTAHYLLGDVFVMPSEGEGFGICFIEASACGRPVLGGNLDGSGEAIIERFTGLLCNPKDENEILEKTIQLLNFGLSAKEIQASTINSYNFDSYAKNIYQTLQQ